MITPSDWSKRTGSWLRQGADVIQSKAAFTLSLPSLSYRTTKTYLIDLLGELDKAVDVNAS